jgi:hypothetical protein
LSHVATMVLSLHDRVYIRSGKYQGRTGVIRDIVNRGAPLYRLAMDTETNDLYSILQSEVVGTVVAASLTHDVTTNLMEPGPWRFGGRNSTRVLVELLARSIIEDEEYTNGEWLAILNTRLFQMNAE